MSNNAFMRSVRLFLKYQATNLSAGMAYRVPFLTQVFGMALNNTVMIGIWLILFDNVSDVAGYDFAGIMFLVSMTATGFGIVAVCFGNSYFVSRIIFNGELDVYLLQPKPILLNLLISRSNVPGWGDILYGVILFLFTQPLTIGHLTLFVLFSLLFALVFLSMRVLLHSLTFFLGNADEFAMQGANVLLMFSLYPGSLFKGPVLIFLHSLIPAALAAWIPYELFREFNIGRMALLVGGDLLIAGTAILIFRLGLRQYESGNKIGARI